MKKICLMVLLFCISSAVSFAEVQTQEIEYSAGDTTLKGYLAFDNSIEGKRPGILVVHEWWGHNDYARKRARMLAELGYTAFAVDMYGDGKQAKHPDNAGAFAGEVMGKIDELGLERFLAALDLLKKHESVDSEKIAAIGYCFGGGIVLHMARFGVDIDGVVSFHGSLSTKTPAKAGAVKAKVLVCHGQEDNFVTPEGIETFKNEMQDAQVDYQFMSYEGAKHSFTNPLADEKAKEFGIGLAYNEAADKASWQDMQSFFNTIFND